MILKGMKFIVITTIKKVYNKQVINMESHRIATGTKK